MSERQPLVAMCPACHQPMTLQDVVEKQTEQGPRIEILACASGCAGSKVAVVFEMAGVQSPGAEEFVHREVARRGAFFPADYGTRGGMRGLR